ncbi:helix-turn-helix transcriptional regulator [Bradyrhizobium sp. WSM 1738]|uniref:helix-turn-helix transcriptional regulator n=1 Tax=Bradyrhizobium hereditatis TaxID=2821405 RepID=UPI001CE2C109|nr:helix-turn-helix transcriptional regulator [Bradyrhizobium hereditatis]MCA6115177.1 helix-turn-helix transcriptional regulator [Bradyrhizobium hereditatis]
MDLRKVVGADPRRFRLGLSQEAVAERMGVDRPFISSMERGLQPRASQNLQLPEPDCARAWE